MPECMDLPVNFAFDIRKRKTQQDFLYFFGFENFCNRGNHRIAVSADGFECPGGNPGEIGDG